MTDTSSDRKKYIYKTALSIKGMLALSLLVNIAFGIVFWQASSHGKGRYATLASGNGYPFLLLTRSGMNAWNRYQKHTLGVSIRDTMKKNRPFIYTVRRSLMQEPFDETYFLDSFSELGQRNQKQIEFFKTHFIPFWQSLSPQEKKKFLRRPKKHKHHKGDKHKK